MSDPTPRTSAPKATPLDASGRWSSHGPLAIEILAFYGFLLVVLLLLGRATGPTLLPDPVLVLALIVGVFLARYASTTYTMDSDRLTAWRLFGSRSIPFERIRRIEFANLRELSATGFFGGWGWRGRMWSPVVGSFDSIHTRSAGVLVYEGDVPLFVSPRDPGAFAAELSRRARSWGDSVELGPGIPGGRTGTPAPPSVQ